VPRRIAYDNLKCTVIQVGQGRNRRLNKRFKELRAWYLFDTRFCNIAKGNEKGDVENGCKRSERTYLSPPPHVEGLSQLAGKLFDDCHNDLKRQGPEVHGGKTVGELLEEERPCLLPLQSERFEACRRRSTFVDSQGLTLGAKIRSSENPHGAMLKSAHTTTLKTPPPALYSKVGIEKAVIVARMHHGDSWLASFDKTSGRLDWNPTHCFMLMTWLLWDTWRVASRLLRRGRALGPATCLHRFHDRKIKRLYLH